MHNQGRLKSISYSTRCTKALILSFLSVIKQKTFILAFFHKGIIQSKIKVDGYSILRPIISCFSTRNRVRLELKII